MPKIMTAKEAVQAYVKDGATVAFGGFIGACHAEEVTAAFQSEFLETGHPCNLTIMELRILPPNRDGRSRRHHY